MDELDTDVYKAATKLREAIQSARSGHRGVGLSRGQILETANVALYESGFKLDVD